MTGSGRLRVTSASLLLLGLVLVGRIASTYGTTSATIDEGRHIAAGVEAYETGAFSLYYWSPALPRYAQGLLPYLAGTRLHTGIGDGGAAGVLESRYWEVLTLARLGTLAFVPVLLVYAYFWSSRLFGRHAGLLAATLVGFSPDVIAHGALATTDLPSAATLLAALFHLWRWTERRSVRAALWAGIAVAAALLCKGPALLQLLLVLALFVALGHVIRRQGARHLSPRPAPAVLLQVGLFAATILLPVWAAYRFAVGSLAERPGAAALLLEILPPKLAAIATTLTLPMPAYLHGALVAWSQAREGWRAFFLGEVRSTGWWYYFPVALALKMTLPSLALLALGGGRCLRHVFTRPRARRALYPVVAAAALLGVAMTSRVNIGVRHVLPVEVVFAVVASAVLAGPALGPRRRTLLRPLALGLLAWHTLASAAAHPNYVAYFNPIAGNREWLLLGDSNLDWGQDVARLADYLRIHEIREVSLYVFGADERTLKSLGVEGAREAGDRRPRGWVAASTNALQGLGPGDARWLSAYSPVARIGRSIFVYDIPAPEPRPRAGRRRDRIPAPP